MDSSYHYRPVVAPTLPSQVARYVDVPASHVQEGTSANVLAIRKRDVRVTRSELSTVLIGLSTLAHSPFLANLRVYAGHPALVPNAPVKKSRLPSRSSPVHPAVDTRLPKCIIFDTSFARQTGSCTCILVITADPYDTRLAIVVTDVRRR
jgi:hypothetical protein